MVFSRRNPPRPANADTAITVAPANGALRKNRTSSSASRRRISYQAKLVPVTAATAKQAMITGEVQPRPGPSMIAYTSVASVIITSNCPTGSNRRARGAFDSGTKTAVSTIAAMPTGMLTQKMLRQPTALTSTPPTTGPSAIDRPTTPPQIPMARARSVRSVNVFVMIDIATGLSIDPPMACTIRKATSAPRLGARLHSSDPIVNTARPVWKVLRRPTRSAVEPASISRLAITSA